MSYPDGHPDKHPIDGGPPGATLEHRLYWLECHVAMLWDQVWWMALPEDRRKGYEAEGFKAPIDKFYGRSDPWPR
jgi:hypothetical protein